MASAAHAPTPIRGLAAGLAGGLIASFAMDRFQSLWSKAVPMPEGGDPATVKAASKLSCIATGEPIAEPDKKQAGSIVHYLFGAGLGAAYGLAAEYRPVVTKGFGTGFAAASATLFDEIAVPAAGLSGPPSKSPPQVHAYSYASHLLFGAVNEGVRRALRRR
jgi:putative membrane protein